MIITRYNNLVGQRYTRLTVVRENGRNKHGSVLWLCECDCGNQIEVSTNSLHKGNTKSCGCLYRDYINNLRPNAIKHGDSKTRLYNIWRDMKLRCYNEKQTGYKNYGARGIKLCDEWLNDFISFKNWAIDAGYQNDLTLDRLDNDGDYEPSNCKWSTPKEQSNHKRNNRCLEYRGEKHTIAEWSNLTGIAYHLIWNRLKNGWSVEDIFERNGKRE